MDREYYLRRHEEELERALSAASPQARIAHEELAERFRQAAERFGSSGGENFDWNPQPQVA